MDVYEIVKILCKENNISLSELEKKLGLTRNTLYKWKTQSPSIERLLLVANYFNVSVDFLVGRQPKADFNDINYQEIFEHEAEIKLNELFDLLQNYFSVYIKPQDSGTNQVLISEIEGSINGFVGEISENELKSVAAHTLKEIDTIDYDFKDIFSKSILTSLFNGYTPEENFVKELLRHYFNTPVVLSTIVPNIMSSTSESKLFVKNDVAIEFTHENIQHTPDEYLILPIHATIAIDGQKSNYYFYLDIQRLDSYDIRAEFSLKDKSSYAIYSKHIKSTKYGDFLWDCLLETVTDVILDDFMGFDQSNSNLNVRLQLKHLE
ncbi:TPA_asm: helix-turn-helix domain-containing protein [Listeria monocytogenes]|nr:helix-turn-helix transcriptional regulator [Listeria welshimeri]HAB7413727.1 helix-turn-helix domain-containing protein [Listeria monocytogenes]HAB7575566.1 helix-turn-helix domain-containing protein [Listeria monocytogenes]HAB9979083.1 helix-turn-helix domain-containing protein [Listeria monocytogenes]HAC0145341.1 helix-turn-helix domain-containing protein [Listeria monocytogenes]